MSRNFSAALQKLTARSLPSILSTLRILLVQLTAIHTTTHHTTLGFQIKAYPNYAIRGKRDGSSFKAVNGLLHTFGTFDGYQTIGSSRCKGNKHQYQKFS